MSSIDVSVVLTMHREALYLRPTLLSLEACASEAAKTGIKVELIAAFDRADQDTLKVFRQTPLPTFEKIKVTEIDAGSVGLARNAAIQEAEGEFVWIADGDDLLSRNSIVELAKTARNFPHPKVAVCLDYLAAFGEQYHVVRYVGSQWLTAADFAYQHPYVSRIFIRRSVFDSLRYLDLKVTAAFAYEDWDFNARLFAAGFEFAIAPNTVLFYRQRSGSLLRQFNAMSAKMIPHSALFKPTAFRAAMASAREKNPDWSAFIRARQVLSETNFAQDLMAVEPLVGYVIEASRLDPEVEPLRIETAGSFCSVPWNPKHWGFQLERFFQLVGGGSFSDLLLLPWLKPGGAEKYILQILHALHASGANQRLLVISGQTASEHEWAGKLPKGSVFVDLFNAFPMLDDSERDAMAVRALLAVAVQGARLHIKASPFSHRLMDRYGSVISSNFKVIYYRFSDSTYVWRNERLSGPWGISFLRRQSRNIDLLISDCRSIILSDWGRLGAQSDKYQVIYALCALRDPPIAKRLPRKRLLWASRVSVEKRPELTGRIATALRREYPEIVLEVYGQIEGHYQQQILFNVPGVEYCGSFDGFDSLPIERFDAFVYTSVFDGLPNIVLEALAAGLPVIAPDVGGVGEALIDGETGFLVPDLVDECALIGAYVDAVRSLYGNWNLATEIAQRGRGLIAERHSEASFRRRVAEVFDLHLHGEEAVL